LPLSTAQINCSGSDLLFFRKPYIYGPKNGGKYYIRGNRIYGPNSNGQFYISNGYIYGPALELPWLED
jgi:hypothetical protein